MNERIKELLLQAGVSNNWNNADWYSLSPAMVEKFAELIVKDSIRMFADNGYDESVDMLIEHWNIDPRTLRS